MASRASKTMLDMARSLGLVGAAVAVLLFVGPARALIFPGADRAPAVDDRDVVRGFATVAHAPPLVPAGPPAGWRVNAARLTRPLPGRAQLHVGWVTPQGHYVGLDEATGSPAALLRAVLGEPLAVPTTTTIGGVRWQRRRDRRGELALSRTAGRLTVVVTGDATAAQLRLLAGLLR